MEIYVLDLTENYVEFKIDDYSVGIKLLDGKIGDAFCNCNYFLKDDSCNHISFAKEYLKNNKNIENNHDEKYFEFKARNSFESTFEILKFIENDIPILIDNQMYDLIFEYLKEVVDLTIYDDLRWQYNASYMIFVKIAEFIDELVKSNKEDTLKFLEEIINSKIGDGETDMLCEVYSKYGNIDDI